MRHSVWTSAWACAALSHLALGSAFAAADCPQCAEWNRPHVPFRIHGNTYFVGTEGLSAVLVTSDEGAILIDGGSPESAALIAANIETLGFRIEDVKLIVNSHAHFDHAGGIAELQRLSGATVAVSAWSAEAMRAGTTPRGDPQFGTGIPFAPVAGVEMIEDLDTLTVGPIELTAQFTPGHTPGGTSWTWKSCEGEDCIDIVYADSLTAVSADGFLFTRSADYPTAVEDFQASFARVEGLPCDILISPHPGFSELFAAKARGGADAEPNAFIGAEVCRNYVATAREGFEREEAEQGG